MLKKLEQTTTFLEKYITGKPDIALILGTGLNSITDFLNDKIQIPYQDIPNMPISTAPSHEGKMIFGNLNEKKILILQGRIHYYEGYSMQEVTYPIRILQNLGIQNLIITNAAGSLRKEFEPGDIISIADHINFMGTNPLIGKNFENLGERFPSLNEPYDSNFRKFIEKIAAQNEIKLQSGVYAAVSGPSLETRAECLMLQKLGADMVGMSTVPEVIVARHSQIKILGLSVITNYTNIFHSEAHHQEEIRRNAALARNNIEKLIYEFSNKI